MSSAVLSSRNEQKWGDGKGFVKNYPTNRALIRSSDNNVSNFGSRFNQRTDSSFNPSSPHAENSHFRKYNDPRLRCNPVSRPPSLATTEMFGKNSQVSVNGDDNAFRGKFESFDLASFSRYNLKELKNRLISELRRVRCIIKRIEAHETESRSSGEKRNVGQKRGKTGSPPPVREAVREAKRRAVDSQVTSMRKCREALLKLMNLKSAVPFNQPVDVESLKLPDYNLIIKRPMDLGTIKSKLEKNRYRTLKAFAADVRLTFDNAMLYNHKGSKVYNSAQKLLMRFEQLFDPIVKNYGAQFASVKQSAKSVPKALPDPVYVKETGCNLQPLQCVGVDSCGLKVQTESIESEVMLMAVKPVAKSRDMSKREMRIEEKQDLVEQLQEMPPEVAACMVHVLRGRNLNLMLEGDEIELDMESLDVETLWELDRFVSNYKKVSKMREQEQIENPGPVSDPQKHSPVILDNVQMNKKGDEVEEDVDIGEEILLGNFPLVEIEKDVAGPNDSGSSSSSSSSSDSDSPSSTGNSDSSTSSTSNSEEVTIQSPFVQSAKESQGAA